MKTKYDWWAAVLHVINYNFIGFMASEIIALFFLALAVAVFTLLLKAFGFLAAMVMVTVICVAVIAGLAAWEIKKRGKLYAKY